MVPRLVSPELGKKPPKNTIVYRNGAIDTPSRPRKKRGRPQFDTQIAIKGIGEELVVIPESLRKTVRPAKRLKIGAAGQDSAGDFTRIDPSIKPPFSEQLLYRPYNKNGEKVYEDEDLYSGIQPEVLRNRTGQRIPRRRLRTPHVPHDVGPTPQRKRRRIRATIEPAALAAVKLNEIIECFDLQPLEHIPSSPPLPDPEHDTSQSSLTVGPPAGIPQLSLVEGLQGGQTMFLDAPYVAPPRRSGLRSAAAHKEKATQAMDEGESSVLMSNVTIAAPQSQVKRKPGALPASKRCPIKLVPAANRETRETDTTIRTRSVTVVADIHNAAEHDRNTLPWRVLNKSAQVQVPAPAPAPAPSCDVATSSDHITAHSREASLQTRAQSPRVDLLQSDIVSSISHSCKAPSPPPALQASGNVEVSPISQQEEGVQQLEPTTPRLSKQSWSCSEQSPRKVASHESAEPSQVSAPGQVLPMTSEIQKKVVSHDLPEPSQASSLGQVLQKIFVPGKLTTVLTSIPDDDPECEISPQSRLVISSAVEARPEHIASTNQSNGTAHENMSEPATTVTGPFSAEERKIVDDAFQQVLKNHSVSGSQLRQDIVDWRSTRSRELKDLLVARLRGRPLQSIRRYCQRHYHTAKRGPWTEEEDTTLRRAYAVNKDKWSLISASVGRRGEDCRDRWRDISSRTNVVLGPWSIKEEGKLYDLVQQTLAKGKTEALNDDKSTLTVNWTVISTGMNHTRSAKQCRERYQLLLNRAPDAIRTDKRKRTLPNTQDDSRSWASAKNTVHKFGPGDMYDAMAELANCVSDRRLEYPDPMTIWSICATKAKDSKFTTRLRRRVLDGFLTERPQYKKLPAAQAAHEVCNELQKIYNGVAMERTYSPFKKTRKRRPGPSSTNEEE